MSDIEGFSKPSSLTQAVRRRRSTRHANAQIVGFPDEHYLTPTDTVENDTLPVHRTRSGVAPRVDYDANRAFGIVLYVHGLSTDQPVAVTRVNYADATDLSIGAVTWKVYAPFSTIPLWNSRGRADRAVMGGTASPGGDRICEDSSHDRCVELGLVWGEFSYMILADKLGAWQGTLLLDKADATGTFYRRNRSYDPNTARFTQEDPIGLAGGMNLYGFAGGGPVNFSDPFGLCPPEDPDNYSDCHVGSPGWFAYRIDTQQGNRLANNVGGVFATAMYVAAGFEYSVKDRVEMAVFGLADAIGSIGAGSGESAPQYKVPASGKSGAEAATHVPSWAKGNRPLVGENGKSFAKRLLDQKYGEGNWRDTGPRSEFSKIKKWGDRGFVTPPK